MTPSCRIFQTAPGPACEIAEDDLGDALMLLSSLRSLQIDTERISGVGPEELEAVLDEIRKIHGAALAARIRSSSQKPVEQLEHGSPRECDRKSQRENRDGHQQRQTGGSHG
jgi:hypothetical protein